jgi:hypothetical protein
MKRTELKRNTRLRRTGMSPRRTELKRSTKRLRLRAPVPTPAESDAREIVEVRSGGRCEVAIEGICVGGRPNFHHRKDKSVGGQWSASNGLAACGSGSTGCHGWITEHPAGARAKGWSVRSHIDLDRTPLLVRGQWLLFFANRAVKRLRPHEVVTSVDGTEPVFVGEL